MRRIVALAAFLVMVGCRTSAAPFQPALDSPAHPEAAEAPLPAIVEDLTLPRDGKHGHDAKRRLETKTSTDSNGMSCGGMKGSSGMHKGSHAH